MRPEATLPPLPPLPSAEALLPALRAQGIELPAGRVVVGAFGDSAELSQELLALIRDRNKRGGASLLWAIEADGELVPEVGDIEIVVDHANAPSVITRLVAVEIVPFDQVTAAFAARENEGDGSLESWRREHWRFFSRECARIGREPAMTMPVVCSSFEVLHQLPERR